MSDDKPWAFPESVQPKAEETAFDLARALDAAVLVRVDVPEDAHTAETLGTERAGYGVVIREDGLVLTIGYLIAEASQIWLTTNRGGVVAGHPLAYDQATGFGLVQPLGRLDAAHLSRGSAAAAKVGDDLVVIGHGGRGHALRTRLIARQEFAGYWEYVLDDALFTAPAHPQWGGAALLDGKGEVIGIGSLLVQHEVNGETIHANMFVPIDILEPIFDSLVRTGASPHPPQPWLGMYTQDPSGKLVVARVSPGGPAEHAGILAGDLVLGVGGTRVQSLVQLFRAVRGLGSAGVEVPLTLARGGDLLRITVKSADRNQFFRKPSQH